MYLFIQFDCIMGAQANFFVFLMVECTKYGVIYFVKMLKASYIINKM